MAVLTDCYDTALCIIPRLLNGGARSVDRLRSYHDKTYGEWPPHINLIYPFVQLNDLSKAAGAISSALSTHNLQPFRILLDTADVVQDGDYVYRRNEHTTSHRLKGLRKAAVEALGQEDSGDFQIHLTIAQSEEDMDQASTQSLLDKAGLLPGLDWEIHDLWILRREPTSDSVEKPARNAMQAWAKIPLGGGDYIKLVRPGAFYPNLDRPTQDNFCPYSYHRNGTWQKAIWPGLRAPRDDGEALILAISTYSVCADRKKYPWLVNNILAADAKAEILVLQEVTDDFLSYLLQQEGIRKTFPFCSHGPPNQEDVDPLPNISNVVVLSKYAFDWQETSCKNGHTPSLIVEFREIGTFDVGWDTFFRPLTLAAVGLSHRMVDNHIGESNLPADSISFLDASVAVKRRQIDEIVGRAGSKRYPAILAGNFSAPTSSHTVSHALTSEGRKDLCGLLKALDGFRDAWTFCRLEKGLGPDDDVESAFEGEYGATYDPTVNTMAAQAMGREICMRPQRFDKVLVKGEHGDFQILDCNKFGCTPLDDGGEDGGRSYASDHWGVRAVLRLGPDPKGRPSAGPGIALEHLVKARGPLADEAGLIAAMESARAIPSQEAVKDRAAAFELLKDIILGMGSPGTSFVFEPVGTYGLGMWTSSSHVECICVGTISLGTFIQLASVHLHEAVDKGVKFRRRKQRGMATFLDLSVCRIVFQLRYAAVSHAVFENWHHTCKLVAADTMDVFKTTVQKHSLAVMSRVLGFHYVRRSIPNIAQFQLAYRFIHTWAKKRGIYGDTILLSELQITIMLITGYKAWSCESAVLSVSNILRSFFSHYSKFDVERNVVFDSFFHKDTQTVRRKTIPCRNTFVVLDYLTPGHISTSAHHATACAQTLMPELRRADELLSRGMGWSEFLESDGATDFLHSFRLYCKIDVQFWGGALTKGRALVQWILGRMLELTSSMQQHLKNYHVRFWPARWVDKTEQTVEPDDQAGHYQCCYLIGLYSEDDDETMDSLAMYHLRKFEANTLNLDTWFKITKSGLGVRVVKSDELQSLEVDPRDWHEYSLMGDDEDAKKEASDQQRRDPPFEDEDKTPAASAKKKKMKMKKAGKQPEDHPRAGTVRKPEGAGKLRPAQDVLNRLRWDPEMDSADYVVGYLDRFDGAMERSLDEWKAEQTDEEFIPQHRILYFKKSDGVVVWERKTRTDLVFGSG